MTTNLVDPASCHMLVSRIKAMQMSENLPLRAGGSVYGSLNGLLSTQRRRVSYPSDGITALTVQLIPGRTFRDHQTTRRGNFAVWGLESGWPKQKLPPFKWQLQLLTQANEAEANKLVYLRCWTNSPPIRL